MMNSTKPVDGLVCFLGCGLLIAICGHFDVLVEALGVQAPRECSLRMAVFKKANGQRIMMNPIKFIIIPNAVYSVDVFLLACGVVS